MKLATFGPGMSARVRTSGAPAAGAAAPPDHLSIHLSRGKELRTETLRACGGILLVQPWCLLGCQGASLLSQLEAVFITRALRLGATREGAKKKKL